MRILILGCNKVAEQLATDLAKEDHEITVMDTNPDRLLLLRQEPHVDAVLASDSIIEDLRGVGINNIDVLIAISDNDNKNVLAAQVARKIFQVPEVICRVGDPQRQEFYAGLGINVFCPTLILVDTIKKTLNSMP